MTMIKCRTRDDDWKIFTSAVLLVSSTSRIAREELDNIIKLRSALGHDVSDIIRARDGVAALATIPDHLDQDNADD
jgi:hypothetical protein